MWCVCIYSAFAFTFRLCKHHMLGNSSQLNPSFAAGGGGSLAVLVFGSIIRGSFLTRQPLQKWWVMQLPVNQCYSLCYYPTLGSMKSNFIRALLWKTTVTNALLVFRSTIRGSSLNANYHKVHELCGSQISSVNHYITGLLVGSMKSDYSILSLLSTGRPMSQKQEWMVVSYNVVSLSNSISGCHFI